MSQTGTRTESPGIYATGPTIKFSSIVRANPMSGPLFARSRPLGCAAQFPVLLVGQVYNFRKRGGSRQISSKTWAIFTAASRNQQDIVSHEAVELEELKPAPTSTRVSRSATKYSSKHRRLVNSQLTAFDIIANCSKIACAPS